MKLLSLLSVVSLTTLAFAIPNPIPGSSAYHRSPSAPASRAICAKLMIITRARPHRQHPAARPRNRIQRREQEVLRLLHRQGDRDVHVPVPQGPVEGRRVRAPELHRHQGHPDLGLQPLGAGREAHQRAVHALLLRLAALDAELGHRRCDEPHDGAGLVDGPRRRRPLQEGRLVQRQCVSAPFLLFASLMCF